MTQTAFAGETAVPYPVLKLALGRITAAEQVRKHFDADKLRELGESIKAHGVVQPIVVRTRGEGYEIIAGERRWRAAGLAGVDAIPAIVRDDLSDVDAAVLQALENLQREDLTLAETCAAVAALVASLGFDATCTKLGKSAAWVSHHARIGELPDEVQTLVNDGKVESAEIAHLIGQLKAYNGGSDYRHTVKDFAVDGATPPTREQLRNRVRFARERHESRQAEKADPKLQQKVAREKDRARKQKLAHKDAMERGKQLRQEGDHLEQYFRDQLVRLMPGDYSACKPHQLPVGVRCAGPFYGNRLPATAEDAGFDVEFCGPISVIATALNCVAPGAKVEVELLDITQDEARKIERALGRPVEFRYYVRDISGTKLRAAIGRATTAATPQAMAEKQGDLDVAAFVAERLDRSDAAVKTKASDVYTAYVGWCAGKKIEALAFTDNRFGDAIAAAGIEKVRSNGIRYVGVTLRP